METYQELLSQDVCQMSYEERVRHADQMFYAASDAEREYRFTHQPQFLRTAALLYEKALEIALEELDKGRDEYVKLEVHITNPRSSTNPREIVVNAADRLGFLYQWEVLSDTSDHKMPSNISSCPFPIAGVEA